MSCPECGTRNQPDSKYCIGCGKPLTPTDDTHTLRETSVPEPSAQAPAASPTSMAAPGTPSPAAGAVAPVPMPPIPANPTPQAGGTDATTMAVKPDRRRAILITILAALIAICVVAGGLVAWNVFGPKTVPQISVDTASDAVSQLEGHGFKVVRKKQYAGAKKGSYLGLDGVKPGDRLSAGSTVTVVESAGPGVPEGTVGLTPDKAEDNLKGMGVTLTEHEVVSDKPGQVVITTPADGDPVTDTQDGIHLGVGVEGEGIPVEIAGQDMNDAQSALEDKGYTVTMEPRFSSRQYLGKIVGANPSIGLKTDTKDVTLYYGVDASKRYDVLTHKVDDYGREVTIANLTNRLEGEYCTDGGDCFNLIPYLSSSAQVSGTIDMTNGDWQHDVKTCPYMQNGYWGCVPSNQTDDKFQKTYMKGWLISGDTGAFELHEGDGFSYCGDKLFGGGATSYHCENGTAVDGYGENTGLTYKPEEFLLYMPVNADLKTLKSNGYFDGKSTYEPDKDRPYIIRRDNTKYTDFSKSFIPNYDGKMAAFKDAPNKNNVYYLIENPIDWNLFDEKVISEAKTTESKMESSDSQSVAKAEATTDFATFAGKYILSGGAGGRSTMLTLAKDGTFTGKYSASAMGETGDDYPNGTVDTATFTGRFKTITKNKNGTYTLECDASSLKLKGAPGQSEIQNGLRHRNVGLDATGMTPCGEYTGFPDASDRSAMPEETVELLDNVINGGTDPMLLNNQLESGLPFVTWNN
ncbi:serine/threonine protein kinase [Bifidobacterium sp. SO4]|uniref:zinc-ribbon domain-containing protein n=1 Tax=Bifidobacterium sp. SO4 TaxID=2809030 RepID=UPI001BDBE415|nr:serine/threonine protein kinase [Bifidobacterium sp. SO4]MBT1171207.1 serine/threonine protein kinase [Bifidobacterium sp. SO4]